MLLANSAPPKGRALVVGLPSLVERCQVSLEHGPHCCRPLAISLHQLHSLREAEAAGEAAEISGIRGQRVGAVLAQGEPEALAEAVQEAIALFEDARILRRQRPSGREGAEGVARSGR